MSTTPITQSKEYKYKLEDKKLMEIYNSDTINIYESDLKYKNMNNIKLSNIIKETNNTLPNIDIDINIDINIDKDTIKYRILESQQTGGVTLDLSHLELTNFPIIPRELNITLKYLFISENKLTKLDVRHFSELIVLDVCSNNLSSMPLFGEKVEELLIKNNMIDILWFPNNTSLKRFDCSNNNISEIPYHKSLSTSLNVLVCSYNKITKIINFDNLTKLFCRFNKIFELNDLQKLEILDCDKNKLDYLNYFPNLIELYCCYNNISQLDIHKKLRIIHCHHNDITLFEYNKNLRELCCDYRDDLKLSKQYNIIESNIYQNNILQIKFT